MEGLGASSAYMHEFTWSIFPVCLPNLTARLWGGERECHTKQDRGLAFWKLPMEGVVRTRNTQSDIRQMVVG